MEILRVRSMYQYAHAVCVCKQSVEGEDLSIEESTARERIKVSSSS